MRRAHKDTAEILDPLVQYLDTENGKRLCNLLKEVLGKTRRVEERMEGRIYYPRELKEYDIGLIDINKFRSINSSQATPYILTKSSGEEKLFGSQRELLEYLGVGKTKFKSPAYQAYLEEQGIARKKISKKEYFALEGSTTSS